MSSFSTTRLLPAFSDINEQKLCLGCSRATPGHELARHASTPARPIVKIGVEHTTSWRNRGPAAALALAINNLHFRTAFARRYFIETFNRASR